MYLNGWDSKHRYHYSDNKEIIFVCGRCDKDCSSSNASSVILQGYRICKPCNKAFGEDILFI